MEYVSYWVFIPFAGLAIAVTVYRFYKHYTAMVDYIASLEADKADLFEGLINAHDKYNEMFKEQFDQPK